MRSIATIFGTNNATPGVASAPSTLLEDSSASTIGLLVKAGTATPATGQVAIRVLSSTGTTVWETQWGGVSIGYNMKVGAAFGFFTLPVCLNGQQNPPCAEMPDGATAGVWRCFSGTGAPGAGTVGTASVGDWYLRRDTPSTANQRLYICSVAGTPGTWVGRA